MFCFDCNLLHVSIVRSLSHLFQVFCLSRKVWDKNEVFSIFFCCEVSLYSE